MKNLSKLMIITTAAILLSGCASIVNGTKETVSVSTKPVKGATCKLSNKNGTWYVKKTPGSVKVHRAYGDLDVSCTKPNYKKAEKHVKSQTKAMAFGNLVFGGVIGAGVDVANGAAYNYPVEIDVPMAPLDAKETPKKQA